MEDWQDFPEESLQLVEALLSKHPPHVIERMFHRVVNSRRSSAASFATSSNSSLYSERMSIASSLSLSSSIFTPSIASSTSSRSRRKPDPRSYPYASGLDPTRPVPASIHTPISEIGTPIEAPISETSSICHPDTEISSTAPSVAHSSTRSHSGAQLFCTYCPSVKTFGTKSDWKKHESRMHETGQDWPCPAPGCSRIFDREKDFTRHHHRYHPGRPLPPLSDVKVELLPKKVFGCGFDNCKTVILTGWDDRCDHIAKHMKDGMTMTQWRYSNVIRNLIRQDATREAWKGLFSNFGGQFKTERSQICWYPDNTRILKQKLECVDMRPNRDEFLMTALQLGLDLPSQGESGFADPTQLPKGFVTPSVDSVENITAMSSDEIEQTLQGSSATTASRFRFDLPITTVPITASPDLSHLPLSSEALIQDPAPPYHETAPVHYPTPEKRISYMDVDSVPGLGLSVDTTNGKVPEMDPQQMSQPPQISPEQEYTTEFADPGRPSVNPLMWSYPNYYDAAPQFQDSQYYNRPSFGSMITKPLKKFKSGLNKQQMQQQQLQQQQMPPPNGMDHSGLHDYSRPNSGHMQQIYRDRTDSPIDPMHHFNVQG